MDSPFKFLEAYEKKDYKRFFGREKETAQLFNAVHRSNLTLLYGASGTGKTSLVNCGLGNKFYEPDWLPIFIRRQDNINETLNDVLTKELDGFVSTDKLQTLNVTTKLQALYDEYYRPIYLIFDQFEEIFVLGDEAEQELFYDTVHAVLSIGLRTRIIIIVREEWIAYLYEFEKTVPVLFENRLRIEKMSDQNVYTVIEKTCAAAAIDIDNPETTIELIIHNIRDKKEGVELTNVQVYLDRLYRQVLKDKRTKETHIVFNEDLVKRVGAMHNVLSAFLDEQFGTLELTLKNKGLKDAQGIPLEILYTLVTINGTKQSLSLEKIMAMLPKNRGITQTHIEFCLSEFNRLRLLRPIGE